MATRAGLILCLLLPGVAGAQTERKAHTPQELSAAIAASGPGDTVVMANGTWTDVEVSFFAEGAEADSITLRAETPGQVVLNGTSRLSIGGRYLKVDGLWFDRGALASGHVVEFRRSSSNLTTHSRLTNCAITHYNPPDYLTQYKWVSVYGRHNRVDHCHFAGKTHDGATVVVWLADPPNDAPVWHRIDNNYFGNRPELGKNGGESLRIGTSSRSMQNAHVTVEHNLFEECDGEIEIISNKSGQNVFRHNTFRRSSGVLTLRHGNDAHVHGNYFLGEGKSGSGGVRIIGERHRVYNNYFQDLEGSDYRAAVSFVNGIPNSPLNRYFQVRNAFVGFNTFVNVEQAFIMGAGSSSSQSLAPDSLTIVSNLVFTRNGPIIEYEDAPLQATYAANIVYGARVGIDLPNDGIAIDDPELSQLSGLWRPSLTSPAVGRGLPVDFVTRDIDGHVRDMTPEVGADEISSGAIVYRPLTAQDVGPAFMHLILQSVPTTYHAPVATLIAYPNPFREATTLEFALRAPGQVRLVLYDLLGREVSQLVNGYHTGGRHLLRIEADGWAPGAYLVVLSIGEARQSRVIFRQ